MDFPIMMSMWSSEQVVKLLNDIGGVNVLTQSVETVIVCADGFLHSSNQCVNKDWLFSCIIKGKILPINRLKSAVDSDSDESQVIDLPALNKLFVQTSGSEKRGKRTTKRNCCIYCGTLDPKLQRHMETFHSRKIEVARILSLKKGSNERKQQWALLAAKGNNLHNKKIREQGYGMLIPKYRPTNAVEPNSYLPCEYCKMLFVSTDLWKHHLSCVAKPTDEKSAGPTRNSRLLPVSESIDQHFTESVVVTIRNDTIGQTAKTDPLILAFGIRRFEKTGKHEHTFNHIACRMRELARLVLAMNNKNSSITTLEECIKPALWGMLVQTIKEEAGFDPNMYKDEYDDRVSSIARDSLSTAKLNMNMMIEFHQ
ncbi:hypothetical protein KUTeg_014608 [Tegillarca granosa]|uniref:BRCT domain-containing protein n=1 Tax=Tegillarca granosa TaxID=220873 RepID=A0ABQ9EVS3_TEGGR|nr:hypothetical protein KUTeg_014608 [Tegillarca granosa]